MQSEPLLQAVIDTMIDGVILIDHGGIVRLYNPACEKLFGYQPDEVLGRNVKMLMPSPYHEEHDGYIRHYQHTGEKRIIGIGREVIGRRKDGGEFPFELAVAEADNNGVPMYIGVIHDLTHRRRSEAAQRRSEDTFRLLVEAVEDHAIFLVDPDGRVASWNDGARRLLGLTADAVLGESMDLFHPTEPEQAEFLLRQAASDGRATLEAWRYRKDGSRFWAKVSLTAVHDQQGRTTGYTKIIHDVTERRRAEEMREQLRQSQKMEAIGQLTGGIAHDFNNLLAVVIGSLELLGDRVAEDQSRKLIDQALHGATRGAELTQRLLAFGRQQTLHSKRVAVNSLIASVAQILQHTLGDTIAVRTSLAPGLPDVQVDPGLLDNALINLALNARDAMPQGGTLTIRTALEQRGQEQRGQEQRGQQAGKPGSYVMIAVGDTGTGMPDGVRERAFEPFYTTKEIGKGSGLGLSMVHGFITQSGGFVHIDSTMSKGTEVRLYLPGLSTISAEAAEKAAGPVVLLVDDNPDVRTTLAMLLDSLGYSVRAASSGMAALDILQSGEPVDLLFTDVMMPEMNGLDLAERALRIRPSLPVVFTSGTAGEEMFRTTPFRHNAPMLAKPVRKQVLAETLQRLLKR
ncbi:PAS domain-containing sensor histidine kinase [Ferrovibrio sp.]|uniref:hybrid sensor histidine kinase/response regulator n=1 Tax=Ferrovibrio sp. TaxID=1917215 RepID=UPI001B5E2B95|nr:PAS domain S-box protein [Ferrovibrio sp.]MBP7062725.1 PAS domain S-box protein [Ferrovibrio sp.]